MIRRSTLAIALALTSVPAVAQETPAGDTPSKEAKEEAAKPNPDQVKASVEEDAQPVKRSISVRGHVTQAELALDTARLTVAYSSAGSIQIQRLDASGGVTVKSPSETASGDFGVYDLDRKLITLVGDVRLNRGGSQIIGSRLLIDLNSGRAVIDGGPAGVAQSGGRVRGHFTVPKRGN